MLFRRCSDRFGAAADLRLAIDAVKRSFGVVYRDRECQFGFFPGISGTERAGTRAYIGVLWIMILQ
jgi:hypothetical protein